MAFRKTLLDLRTAMRDGLDEPRARFWTDGQLNRYLTRATDACHAEARKTKSDYFLIKRTSLDGTVTIYGESYNCASLQIVAGTREYTLPQDLNELKLIEISPTQSDLQQVVFSAADLSGSAMRDLRRLTQNQDPQGGILFDVVGERTLVIAPASDRTVEIVLWYVPSTAIYTSGGAALSAYASDTDQLMMPHPLYLAVEEVAMAAAKMQDQADPAQAQWQVWAQQSVARWMGANARQIQDPTFVEAYEP